MQSVLSFLALSYCTSPSLPGRTPAASKLTRILCSQGSPCISQVHPHLPGQRELNNLGTNRHSLQISIEMRIGKKLDREALWDRNTGRIFSAQTKDGSLMCMWKFFSSGDRAEPCGMIAQLGIYSLRCIKGLLRLNHWSLEQLCLAMLIIFRKLKSWDTASIRISTL